MKAGGVSKYFAGNSNRVEAMAGMNIFALVQNTFAGLFLYWILIYGFNRGLIKMILFFLMAISLLLLSNSKSPIFVLIFSLVILFYYLKFRISFLGILFGSLFVMLGFVFWEVYFREFMVSGEIVTLYNDFSLAQNLFLKFGDFFLGNFMQVQTVSIIMDAYPFVHSHLYGSSIIMIVVIWIPRILFPGKPLTAAGDFTNSVWPDPVQTNGSTLPPGLIGELYMNFSWIGILIGMILIGYFYGILWRKFTHCPTDFYFSGIAVIFTALLLHFFRGELSAPFLSGVFFILPGVVLRFFYRSH
jgi:oligosaccharide repeat unit polymerase